MLRGLVLFLLLANGLYFAWSHNLLAAYGLAPAQQSEPQRMEQQLHPEMVVLLPPHSADAPPAPVAVAASAPAEPTECLTAGLFDMARGTTLAQALATALPTGTWSMEESVEPGRWIVYMGRYPNADMVDRKKAELRGMRVKYEAPPSAMEPGLSLGGFDNEAAATKLLGEVTQHGVRTARVVQEHPEVRGMQLRLPAVDAAMKARLDTLKSALGGKALRACAG
ncbi:SPOR domain-containing protein [Rhodoferax sp.]|uniref:SPOR domain-containing protein n=1 Tax=Rhodoferax sp. TaxID=50421 RepID=UPI00374CE99F